MSAPHPDPEVDATPEDPPRRRGMGSAKNMIISMVVVVAFVLVLLALMPRGNGNDPATVDVGPVAAQVVSETGWAISEPHGLPDGWRPTSVRFTTVEDQRTWHAGYLTSDRQYIGLEQTRHASDRWLGAQTKPAKGEAPAGRVTIDGRMWQKVDATGGDDRSLVHRDAKTGLTSVVTGTASYDELVTFAGHLATTPKPAATPTGG